MSPLGLILLVLIILFFCGGFGAHFGGFGPGFSGYGTGGFGLGGILLVILVILLLTGRL